MKKMFFLIFIVSNLAYGTIKYEDIPPDHWAYSSIKNLVENGIIPQDGYTFRGETNVKRYDFAYSLSKLLNKVELEKANKKDLLVLENLVSEFTSELTKIGFDTTTFNNKIENINETIELLKISVEQNQKLIAELTKRVEKLER